MIDKLLFLRAEHSTSHTSGATWKSLEANMLNHVLDYLLERGIVSWCVPMKLIMLFLLHFIEITAITLARGTIVSSQVLITPPYYRDPKCTLSLAKRHLETDWPMQSISSIVLSGGEFIQQCSHKSLLGE